ncbi:hypothetical protein HH214_09840 [Mucilaginibacter robiniae]|uniref:Uncharacterized protein n=1 Tax=Mucilaginibacter robiniae TaxID=2728022 RepID=A0A7L5DZD2_9SPHI|nr:hypothetical protein [Mucilaginibacter robiniae]QJD96151.1 hypothetical protein HH214_09840 [Mucilaginibacter robiniae]
METNTVLRSTTEKFNITNRETGIIAELLTRGGSDQENLQKPGILLSIILSSEYGIRTPDVTNNSHRTTDNEPL